MNEKGISQSAKSIQKSKYIWTIIITMAITAIIVGSGVYIWQTSSLQSTEKNSQQSDEVTKIIQEIGVYCKKYNTPGCLPITSYSVIDLGEKYGVVKIGDVNYLLTKKNNEWNVSIASEEKNICETGSDSPDLVEYCRSIKITK
jgi:hypothetical protein